MKSSPNVVGIIQPRKNQPQRRAKKCYYFVELTMNSQSDADSGWFYKGSGSGKRPVPALEIN